VPSIASVSRFLLQTREATSDVGTEVFVNGGKLVHVRECGRPVGTRIEVTQLFNSVPARRKFLKSDQTEAAHIVHCVRLYALACPGTAFTLIEDGRVIFRSPECASLMERIAEIFGRQTAEALLPLESTQAGFRLSGLIGRPGVGRATRHEMIVFVNARPVDSRTLNYALIESYHESLPKGRYPLAFVFFDCDPAAVDVNVHPAKREVRFRSEAEVRGFVIRAVLERLREAGTPETGEQKSESLAAATVPQAESRMAAPFKPFTNLPSGFTLEPRRAGDPASAQGYGGHGSAPHLQTPAPNSPASGLRSPVSDNPKSEIRNPQSAAPSAPAAPAWRFLALAHGNYAMFETAAGLVLLDRRAAHERVWFERLREQFRTGAVPSQRLLLPVPVEFDTIAAALLLDRLRFLDGHGFVVAEFGRNFFRIEAVPAWMEPADAEPFLRDLVGAFRDGRIPDRNVELAHEELARMAAAKAIRLPETATETELRTLITQLFATRSPLTSPGGRPTYIELNHAELTRRFQK
jgi:DNA mismatch repair protein MutL